MAGGETAGRERMHRWLRDGIADYDDDHDALGNDNTSRLSPYLHFGCVSPVELVREAGEQRSSAAASFVRQVAWRDFHHQVLAARPDATREDYRPRGDRWHSSGEELQAWKEGRTGYPVVDAGMRQLAREGWMHNRARLITGHFLTKTLYIDWREGAQHFVDLLLDADVANNTMNWQWVAGTGTDSRFNRTYNVTLQARRHDPTRRLRPALRRGAGRRRRRLRARAVAAARGRVRGAGLPGADRRPAGGQGAAPRRAAAPPEPGLARTGRRLAGRTVGSRPLQHGAQMTMVSADGWRVERVVRARAGPGTVDAAAGQLAAATGRPTARPATRSPGTSTSAPWCRRCRTSTSGPTRSRRGRRQPTCSTPRWAGR